MDKKFILILLAVTLLTRTIFLDVRPMDHDESVHAYLSYDLLKNQRYSYDPAYHGPFLYFFTAGVFYIFGDNNFTARLLPVFFSLIGIFFTYRFKRWVGDGVYLLLFFMIFSTSILYYSRYFRNDITLLFSFIAVVYCYFRYIETPDENFKERLKYVACSSVFLSIMFTSKENSYIYTFILVSFIFLYGFYNQRIRYFKILKPDKGKIILSIVFLSIFLSIFISLYTAGFSDMDGFRRATIGSVDYWLTMHEQQDHAKHALYYAGLLLKYEFLPLALSIASIPIFYRRLKDAGKMDLFFAYWVIATLIIYQILSHKVPWLLVHLTAPLAFFASSNLKNLLSSWKNRGFRAGIVILSLVYLLFSLHITYIDYNNAEEWLIYIQVQPSAEELVEKIIERENMGLHGLIFEPEHDYWPLPWYLRKIEMPYSNRLYGKFDYYVTSEINAPVFKNCQLEGKYEIRPNYYMLLFERCSKI